MNKDQLSSLLGLVIVAGTFVGLGFLTGTPSPEETDKLSAVVQPAAGFKLNVTLNDLPAKLVALGVIDERRFPVLDKVKDPLIINPDNARALLNFFWALGLANKNKILTEGPMATAGETANFASTGGWTLAVGEAMGHYAKHELIVLTPVEQELVEKVSKNIYRPCCNNPTHFPDCNHGMAMLGLLELGASQGLNEEELYRLALSANLSWFPDNYLIIAEYLAQTGRDLSTVQAEELLGQAYSSASGFSKIKERMIKVERNLGGSCSV